MNCIAGAVFFFGKKLVKTIPQVEFVAYHRPRHIFSHVP